MTYSTYSHIHTLADVQTFFHHLVADRKLSFHPDDDFADYINYSSNKPLFSADEALIYNRLMEEAFDICDKEGADIYELCMPIVLSAIQ